MKHPFKNTLTPLVAGISIVLGGSSTYAQTLLVDRGLPTDNVNLPDPNPDRSNVAWADNEPAGTLPFAPGDSFSLNTAATVTDIRVWEVGGGQSPVTLLGGISGSPIGVISTGVTATPVTYANGQGYLSQIGTSLPILQLDFTVALSLTAGQTFDFFLANTLPGSTQSPFIAASNAALSGSPQDGSDGTFLFYDPNTGTVDTWDTGTGDGTYDPGFAGWDKNSDANVQVFGVSAPDGGSTMLLLSSGFTGLAFLRRRLNRA
ncbi:MAG TPA: VPDSG-CTERM sorting domain-containing protein [Verrucomicrobiae bacterium]|jgi:hypothetical protein|nr:VPDSG-CTERM sorting domain-containing protein [Verrucomicrobiae bacterium]